MGLPVRFTVCSYNIWTIRHWPERKEALRHFIRLHTPDVLCLQELQADSRKTLDEELAATHKRVEDPFEGWTAEGNIYWNDRLFELVEYGAEDIGIYEKFRRLFWVRLRPRDGSSEPLLVSTAHFTWSGHARELETGINSRIAQAQQALAALNRLAPEPAPMLFMGDLNDSYRPIIILQEGGLIDSFTGLGRTPKFTHPARPDLDPPVTIDWMFHRGTLRPLSTEVVDYFYKGLAPSDHKPIITTYALP